MNNEYAAVEPSVTVGLLHNNWNSLTSSFRNLGLMLPKMSQYCLRDQGPELKPPIMM